MFLDIIFRVVASPLRITGYAIPPALVVAARTMGMVLILRQDVPFGRHIPFFEFLDRLGNTDTFDGTILAAFGFGLTLIFITRWTRVGSILVGVTFLIGLLACRPCQSAAHTYVACFFLIIGMSSHGSGSALLHWQLILLYVGAGIHKAVDPDWWNGKYFETLLFIRHEMPGFEDVAARFPPMLFARWLGVGTILIEFLIPVLLFIKRFRAIGVLTALLFHSVMVLMMQQSFGPFFAALLLTFLTFLPWPDELEVRISPRYRRLVEWLTKFNVDGVSGISIGKSACIKADNDWRIEGTAACLIYLTARTPLIVYLTAAWLVAGPWRGKLIVAISFLALTAWLSSAIASRQSVAQHQQQS